MLLNRVANLKLQINEKEGKVDMCKAWEDRIEKGRQEEREKAEKEKQKMWEDMKTVMDNVQNNNLTTKDLIEQLTAMMC